MNRTKENSVAHTVRSRVLHGGPDRLWTYADFPRDDRLAVAAALSRLARSGKLTRIRRGLYYRPKPTLFGASHPDPEALLEAALRSRGHASIPSGIGEYNRLGFTTQVAGALTRATPRRVSRNPVPGVRARFAERPLDAQPGIRPAERTALDALRAITRIPDASPSDVLRRLKTLLRTGKLDFRRLARYASAEPPRVRALLGAVGDDLRTEGRITISARTLATLRASLNPLTSYRIDGIGKAVTHTAEWRITAAAPIHPTTTTA